MTVHALCWALERRGLSPAAKLLLIYIADGSVSTDPRQFSVEALSDFVGVSDVGLPLAELHAAGLVAVVDGGVTHVIVSLLCPFPVVEYASEPPRPKISSRLRMAIYKRDGLQCVVCSEGDTSLLSIDHIIPISKGGENHPDNLQTLCRSCNSSKRDRDHDEWLSSRETAE